MKRLSSIAMVLLVHVQVFAQTPDPTDLKSYFYDQAVKTAQRIVSNLNQRKNLEDVINNLEISDSMKEEIKEIARASKMSLTQPLSKCRNIGVKIQCGKSEAVQLKYGGFTVGGKKIFVDHYSSIVEFFEEFNKPDKKSHLSFWNFLVGSENAFAQGASPNGPLALETFGEQAKFFTDNSFSPSGTPKVSCVDGVPQVTFSGKQDGKDARYLLKMDDKNRKGIQQEFDVKKKYQDQSAAWVAERMMTAPPAGSKPEEGKSVGCPDTPDVRTMSGRRACVAEKQKNAEAKLAQDFKIKDDHSKRVYNFWEDLTRNPVNGSKGSYEIGNQIIKKMAAVKKSDCEKSKKEIGKLLEEYETSQKAKTGTRKNR